MAAYLIVEIKIKDPEAYAEYIEKVPATVERYGGRYLARGGAVLPLAGDWKPERVIIMEFPSMEQLATWGASPEYGAVSPIREKAADTRAIAVEGV